MTVRLHHPAYVVGERTLYTSKALGDILCTQCHYILCNPTRSSSSRPVHTSHRNSNKSLPCTGLSLKYEIQTTEPAYSSMRYLSTPLYSQCRHPPTPQSSFSHIVEFLDADSELTVHHITSHKLMPYSILPALLLRPSRAMFLLDRHGPCVSDMTKLSEGHNFPTEFSSQDQQQWSLLLSDMHCYTHVHGR